MRETLISALKSASEIQISKFQQIERISEKENISSIVTEVDIECEEKIIEVIKRKFPDHNTLSEEIGLKFKNSKFTWIIDPLDGTSNYAAGLPWFGVLIALMKNNIPVLSGAYIPISDKLFIAESGKGASVNGRILKFKTQEIENSLVAFSIDYTKDEQYLQKGIGIYKYLVQNTRNVRTTNSLIDLLNVAEGKFGGCVNMFNGIWDIAALYLIIKETGGIIKSLDSCDIEFTIIRDNIKRNYPIVAGTELFVKKILEVIRSY